ncbi:MAG TPA: hypothetical protein VGG86_14865 [Roseiarcus sp.]|jgi:hypothetical protein
MRTYLAALAVCAGLCEASVAEAADLPTKKPAPEEIVAPTLPSTWHVEITGYGWGTYIAGNAGFGALPTLSYYAPFSKLLKHLEGAFMSSVIVRNDTFIGGIDLIWSRLGGGARIKNPNSDLFGTSIDLTLSEGIITGFGGVRLPVGVPNLDFYGTVGARYYDLGTKINVTGPLGVFSPTQTYHKGWIDPVAGFAAQYRFNDRWFTNVLGDLGGWSGSATGQALASVGYKWTPNIATTLGYRVMYAYETQDTGFSDLLGNPKSFRFQQWMYGPFAGFKYSF